MPHALGATAGGVNICLAGEFINNVRLVIVRQIQGVRRTLENTDIAESARIRIIVNGGLQGSFCET